jgi:S1-C subfamily serine protease
VRPTRNPSPHHRTLALSGGGIASFSKFIATWTIACWLIAGVLFTARAAMATAGQTASGQGLGSADDYVQSNPDFYAQSNPDFVDTYEGPLLGIAVRNGMGGLEHGGQLSGVEILTVVPGSPGGAAGLHGRRHRGGVFQTALIVGILASAAFFPPAMMGVMVLSGIGESLETIIAVDGERTRDVTDFEEAIEKAEPGEVVYLTVVSGGRREQIRVALPVQ